MNRHLFRAAAALAALALTLGTATAASASASAPPHLALPKSYYLALGDSIAYGFQTSKALVGLPPEAFSTGYADLFAARLARLRPRIATVNYSCPGESTASFRLPCIWKASGHALHDDYPGSQLAAALAFLAAHRGQVSPVTLSLNGDDANEFLQTCPPGDLACLQARRTGGDRRLPGPADLDPAPAAGRRTRRRDHRRRRLRPRHRRLHVRRPAVHPAEPGPASGRRHGPGPVRRSVPRLQPARRPGRRDGSDLHAHPALQPRRRPPLRRRLPGTERHRLGRIGPVSLTTQTRRRRFSSTPPGFAAAIDTVHAVGRTRSFGFQRAR